MVETNCAPGTAHSSDNRNSALDGGGNGNIGTGRTVNLIDGHFQTIVAEGVWKSVTTILQTQSHLTEARQTKTSAWQYLATGPCSGMTHGR